MDYKTPEFKEIQDWSWNRKKDPGTVADAAEHFQCPAVIIVKVVTEMNSPYFYIVGDGPLAKNQHFEHDGE